MIHEAAARGFAQAVDAYERGRPGYPPEAVERLCEAVGIGPGRAVLDLAAGTGKLTRLLVPTGAELVAVEPVEQMRAALARALPEVTALAGTAEDVPLPAASVDAVVAGSAFHWFRGEEALAEIHRVLRPDGRLGSCGTCATSRRPGWPSSRRSWSRIGAPLPATGWEPGGMRSGGRRCSRPSGTRRSGTSTG